MDPLPFLAFFLFVCALAFFAGTEFPLMSVSGHKLEWFVRQKRWGARTLAKLKKNNERLLISNLIATLFVATTPMLIAEQYIVPEMIRILGTSSETTHFVVYVISFLIVLLFGEITSKVLGVRFNDQIALAAAPLYQVLVWILFPLVWIVEQFVRVLSWATGGRLDMHHVTVSEEELDAFIDMSHIGGAVEADEKRQIKNLLGLSDMTADSVMTPRVNVEFLSLDMTVDEACDQMMQSSHSRLPVYGKTTDDVEHVMTIREAFAFQRAGHGQVYLASLDLEKIMKVSLTHALDDLFEKFQRSRRHIALVLDEHGGMAGVITMEDVLEEVFGDIKDEKDREEIYIKKSKDGTIEAIWSVLIDDILEEYDITPEAIGLDEEYMSETLSYVLMAEEEGFPRLGDIVVFGTDTRLSLRVLEVDDNVIERVECRVEIL